MATKGVFSLFAAAGALLLGQSSFGQNQLPPPGDPLELVTGQIQVADSAGSREAAFQLLAQARSRYSVRNAGVGYDLKVSFSVNSGGQTDFDGAWQMEDIFDLQQGLRWTASATGGFSTAQISANGRFYREGSADTVPLRLHEARAALFDPIPASGNIDRSRIRTSNSTFNGILVTCVLLSDPKSGAASSSGRSWDETEVCVDPQSGLLQTQSQVPGRYFAYDYSNAPGLGDYVLPHKVTVTEGGRMVSEIAVESLTEHPSAPAGLFTPSAQMKSRGAATEMGSAQKISRVIGPTPVPAGATVDTVCVFGLVTPSGQLVEAHSLQPSDPNSSAAVEAARQMKFSTAVPRGARPQQHFVFLLEKFVSSK
ncbi:MAG TPA: hypothetical protein VGN17_09700 [Bryobacteraceae bacterium]|jgi:hypothetical protein